MIKTKIIFLLVSFIALTGVEAKAQFNQLPTDRQRLLLELSSGHFNVVKQNEVSLDSSLVIAADYLKLSRAPVILEGMEKYFNPSDLQWIGENKPGVAKKRLYHLSGNEHLKLSVLIGAYYAFQPGNRKTDIDSGLYYLNRAGKEAEDLKQPFWANQVLILTGKLYFSHDDFLKGDSYFKTAIARAEKSGDKLMAAKGYYYRGTYCPFSFPTVKLRIASLEKAGQLYDQLGKIPEEAITLIFQCYLNHVNNDFGKAKKAVLRSLELQNKIHFPFTHYTTDELALLSNIEGNNSGMLNYAFEEVRSSETTGDRFSLALFYGRIRNAYKNADFEMDKVIYWDKKSLDESMKPGCAFRNFIGLQNYILDLLELGRSKEAPKIVDAYLKRYQVTDPVEDFQLSLLLANMYDSLNQNKKAETYFLKALSLKDRASLVGDYMFRNLYYNLGNFYMKINNYKKAKYFLTLFIQNASNANSNLNNIEGAERELAKLEALTKNFESAYNHMLHATTMYDKIYDAATAKQLESLKIKYETAQKEQSIKLLESQRRADLNNLQKLGLQRDLELGGIATLVLLSGVIFYSYRNKQKSNLLLQQQQKEINEQYHSVQKLLSEKNLLLVEKDQLLTDKDLLLREVHHRVKNNLHMVMSLLESQTAYLKNNSAIEAILEGQNRVQAIALIHQKLYSSSNLIEVNMQAYIPELITYLTSSFNAAARGISIEHAITGVKLDVSQAIPVGIILNEAITNAIKYAFPSSNSGKIRVILKQNDQDRVLLQVTDNGIGLSPDFDIHKNNSLGMTLIRGLSDQLEGDFKIESDKGVKITIEFTIDHSINLHRYEILNDEL